MRSKNPIDIIECPGAWYGNSPNPQLVTGCVVVDPTKLVEALDWLDHKFYVNGTRLHNDGVLVEVRSKQFFPDAFNPVVEMSLAAQ